MINVFFEIHGLEMSNSEFVYINTVHPNDLLNAIDLVSINKGAIWFILGSQFRRLFILIIFVQKAYILKAKE